MPIRINLDVMMAKRRIGAGELAEAHRHHPGQPVHPQKQQGQGRALLHAGGAVQGAGLPARGSSGIRPGRCYITDTRGICHGNVKKRGRAASPLFNRYTIGKKLNPPPRCGRRCPAAASGWRRWRPAMPSAGFMCGCLRSAASRISGLGGLPGPVHCGVEAFARALGRRGARGAPFWAVCWLLQGTAMLLYGLHSVLALWQLLAWHLTAVYWVLARTGMQAAGRANAMLAGRWHRRAVHAAMVGYRPAHAHPCRRAGCMRRGRAQRRTPQARRRRQELAAGILLALALGGYALAELSAADTVFGAFIGRWLRWPQLSDRQLARLVGDIFTLLLSLPVGAWLFGLVGGGAAPHPPAAGRRRCLPRPGPRAAAARAHRPAGRRRAVRRVRPLFCCAGGGVPPGSRRAAGAAAGFPLCGGRVLAAVPHPAA